MSSYSHLDCLAIGPTDVNDFDIDAILEDEPISTLKDDRLSRAELVQRCALALQGIKSESAFVVGLSGPWGSGKTSFINMVRECLAKQDEAPLVMSFNAWLYSSQEQLVRQFFSELGRAIGSESGKQRFGEVANRIGGLLTEYSELISEVSVGAIDIVAEALLPVEVASPLTTTALTARKTFLQNLISKFGKHIKKEDKTVEQLRNEIAKQLESLQSNIVVTIDDVDRLSSEDIRALFKLVNLVASFPHMTFLMAFDREVVTSALSKVQGLDGESYLEKIIQLPIDLPPASKDALRVQLTDVLDSYIGSSFVGRYTTDERTRLFEVFEKLVMDRVETPRQAKRYLNKFWIASSGLQKEVCPTDVIGMTAIALFYPTVCQWIWDNRFDVCSPHRSWHTLSEPHMTHLKESLQKAIEADTDSVGDFCDALRTLFPRLPSVPSEELNIRVSVSRETGRVSHLDNLEIFFGVVGAPVVSREHLNHLVCEADAAELESALVALDLQGELKRFVETVGLLRHSITKGRKASLCRALLGVIGKLRQDDPGTYFALSTPRMTALLLVDLLHDICMDAANSLVLELIESFTNDDFIGLTGFLSQECGAHTGSENGVPCLSDDTYTRLARAYVEAMVESFPVVVRSGEGLDKFLWRQLDEGLGTGATERIRAKYKDDLFTRVLCAASTLQCWMVAGGVEYGRNDKELERHEPVFDVREAKEIWSIGISAEFSELSDELKLAVASLYCLAANEGHIVRSADGLRVPHDTAEEVVRRWEDERSR